MNESSPEQDWPAVFREGVMQLQPPRLIGGECAACGTRIFPLRDYWPRCGAAEPPRSTLLSETGTVFSYTVVRQAPPGWRTPYVLAYVDLDDGVRVLAQVDVPHEDLALGLRVRVGLQVLSGPDDHHRTFYVFRPARENEEATA
jgi:uncharacterized OB-fold protein